MRSNHERIEWVLGLRTEVLRHLSQAGHPTDPVTVASVLVCLHIEELTEKIEDVRREMP